MEYSQRSLTRTSCSRGPNDARRLWEGQRVKAGVVDWWPNKSQSYPQSPVHFVSLSLSFYLSSKMAAFSLHYRPSSHLVSTPAKLKPRPIPLPMAVTCMSRRPEEETGEKADELKGIGTGRGLTSLLKLGEGLRGSLTPQTKGDWKDITLMSLSFAVYIYISQKLVCAYSAWISISSTPRW